MGKNSDGTPKFQDMTDLCMRNVELQGLDALLSTVQMPAGIPVASVAIGKAGARNAAYLAAQILALSDRKLAARLVADRVANAEGVAEKDRALQERLKTL